ncbi:hypothetical protein CSIRO_0079 [Bradyrhizobiaceae bacterium SG-6C]|nr:hypothetical protein CSIRO_0079 [Bradyrhizobiaceae bacterium SG-6C]
MERADTQADDRIPAARQRLPVRHHFTRLQKRRLQRRRHAGAVRAGDDLEL